MFTEEEIKKLPMWAQKKIIALQSELKSTTVELQTYFGVTPTKVWVGRFQDEKNYLPERDPIVFNLPNGKISVYIEDSHLHVSGHSTIIVRPRAANCIRIESEI